jgi:hypothetical protein
MGELLVANGFPALPTSEDDRMTMNGVTYFTSRLG